MTDRRTSQTQTGESAKPSGVPTEADQQRALMWEQAMMTSADMWTLLSAPQQDMVRARVEWAFANGGGSHD